MVLGIQLPNPQHRTKDEDSEAISDLQHQLCFSDPSTKTVTKTQLALWIWQGSLQTFTIFFSASVIQSTGVGCHLLQPEGTSAILPKLRT